jgi:DNA-binding HxlR family transcriptional regulator
VSTPADVSDAWWERVVDALTTLGEASSAEVAAVLGCSQRWAHMTLQALMAAGLVERGPGRSHAPRLWRLS